MQQSDIPAAAPSGQKGVGVVSRGGIAYLSPRVSLIETSGLKALQETFDKCIAERKLRLILDFTMVASLNSKALTCLLDYHARLTRQGGWIRISNASNTINEVLKITAVSEQIKVIQIEQLESESDHELLDKVRIGDYLVMKGFLTEDQLAEAIQIQKKTHRRLGDIVVEKKWTPPSAVYGALAQQLKVPYIKLRSGLFDPEVVALLNKSVAERLHVLPLFLVHGILYVATENPQNIVAQMEIESRMQVQVVPVLASPEDISRTIEEVYGFTQFDEGLVVDLDDDFEVFDASDSKDYDAIDEMAEGSPVINMINAIIQRAVADGASDVHIEPCRDKTMVRFRVDGILYEIMRPAKELHPALVSRLKVMANLDITERRVPQDGRIQVHTQGRKVDLRFSSLPGLYGEKVVLRVLDKNEAIMDLDRLGMQDDALALFKSLLSRSHGLVLVTGPTGSGKTTSLYAALNHLNSIEKNIVTIEDPVEYQLEVINQNEVKPQIGLTFAKMLKHILRQDPDIVMIGEIREKETAEIAVQAALTGHLVLSTLHTNNSIGAITRLIDMGIEPFMLSSALFGVVAQRLVRTICPNCKTKFIPPPELVEQYGWDASKPIKLYRGRGCEVCYDSGFKGRAGIHEILETTGDLQKLVMTNPSNDQLQNYMVEHRVRSLREQGLGRVLAGDTTLDEVARVANN